MSWFLFVLFCFSWEKLRDVSIFDVLFIYYLFNYLYLCIYFVVLVLMLARQWTSWATYPAFFFSLVIFLIGSCVFSWASFKPQSSYLCLPPSRNYRCVLTYPSFYGLRWSVVNFLPRLASNYDPLNFHLLTSWDYRHAPLCLAHYLMCFKPLWSLISLMFKLFLPLYSGNSFSLASEFFLY
jgi:hypothetical protein